MGVAWDAGALLRRAAAVCGSDVALWARFVGGLPGPVQRALLADFFGWQAHGGQKLPHAGDVAAQRWAIWLIMAGRGFGKTRAGAEWVLAQARAHPGARIALIGGTADEVAKVMIEGPSGLLALSRDEEEMLWLPTRGVVTFASGAQAFVYSAAAPEGLRGPEHHFAWADELAKWDPSTGSGRGRATGSADRALDNELNGLTVGGAYRGAGSPDRADACVWALSELIGSGEPRVRGL